MTKEEKYAYRATQEMLSVSRFPDWNPSHFLDVGEMVLALSIGYDWLYEYLEPEIRSIVRDAIVEKGLDAAAPDEWFYRILFVMVVYCVVRLQFLRMCRIRQKKL